MEEDNKNKSSVDDGLWSHSAYIFYKFNVDSESNPQNRKKSRLPRPAAEATEAPAPATTEAAIKSFLVISADIFGTDLEPLAGLSSEFAVAVLLTLRHQEQSII